MFVQPVDTEGLGNELFRYGMALGALHTDMTLCKLPQKIRLHNPVKNYRELFNGITYGEKNGRVNSAKNVVKPTNTPREGNAKIPPASWQEYDLVDGAIDRVKDNLIRNEFDAHKSRYTFHHDPTKTAFIHVRLGDYEALGWSLPFTYYDSALELFLKRAPQGTHILVVSDNIQKCKDHWRGAKHLEFIEDKDELQTMHIMMNCEAGAMISLSTFSSWGAMLGADRKAKHIPQPIIIYPTPWLGSSELNKMKFPDWWIPHPTGKPK